ncbi:MAG: biopolymer transporter ExbD [Deltaproteobacteria bacterium]|nr:biopolymer transporter ExbD [Deltaproteobacteria bacterium]NNK05874.1 biopolymer transporter ExbD [Myxococcales bacterium]MBT8465210.1 biopolymer transporter ExbD [Deltaproteobacteria bacterium]MBT8482413.1 biopolymer transporter ExbD [Deltaproteobacteria bacterium]NNK42706.1 biopolymer transporter ExbD [Myxococcales bacterium]
MGLSRQKKGKVAPEMNVTPLVDVVLVLLIIFMVILPAAVSDLNLELVKIQNPDEEREGEPEPYVLSIDVDGRLFFDDYLVERNDLGNHLRGANAEDPTKRLVLVGDHRLTYDKVRGVMAIVQDVGFPGVALRATKTALDDAEAFAKSIRGGGES